MRICPKCRKANLTTRKFCIRCGASLLKPLKRKPAEAKPVSAEETTPFSTPPTEAEPPSPTTEDKWVRPSQVPTDRIRETGHSSKESELEKAKRAFAKAEEVGFDEAEVGIVETRMLRASEVKELLEGPSAMEGAEPIISPEIPAGTPSETEGAIHAPTAEDMEHQILGEWSTLVAREDAPLPESAIAEPSDSVSSTGGTGFSSSRYSETPTDESVIPSEVEAPSAPAPTRPPKVKEEVHEAELSAEHVVTCPQCKSIITIDDYEYPPEIYSAMGNARMKQARYLIVQGRENDAITIAKIARVLFEKANDGDGLAQIEQLADSLSGGS